MGVMRDVRIAAALRVALVVSLLAGVSALSGCTREDQQFAADFFADFYQLTIGQRIKAGLGMQTGNDDVDAVIGARQAVKDMEAADDHARDADRHEQRGEYTEALEDIDKAIDRRPEDPQYYTRRAGLLADRGDTDGAQDDIEYALELAEQRGRVAWAWTRLSAQVELENALKHQWRPDGLSPDARRIYGLLEPLYTDAIGTTLPVDGTSPRGIDDYWAGRAADAYNKANGLELGDPEYRIGADYLQ